MSGCSSTYNGASPTPIQSVDVHQTILYLSDGSGIVDTYTNTDFSGTLLTLPFTPLAGYATSVYVNGLLQVYSEDYTATGASITFLNALTSDTVQVHYAASTSSVTQIAQVFNYTAVLSGTQALLPRVPSSVLPVTVYVNGVLQALTTHYTITGSVITFTYTLASDTVQVLYSS